MNILLRLSSVLLLAVCALGSVPAESQTIVTFGSGFRFPSDAVVDGSGNIFVADQGNDAVKEILATGGYATINTLGSGFSEPLSIAVDGSGNVFVADAGNGAIKEILAAGGYTTVNTLHSGFSFPTGIAIDGSGNVFVADQGNNTVSEILAAGGYTTVNTLGSGFNLPTSVAVDGSGNVFLTNQGDSTVREILAAGGYTTVNTLGSGFNNLWGVAVDGTGNVFVTDSGHAAIKEIVAAGGYSTVVTLAHDLPSLTGLSVDGSGDVFFAQTSPSTIAELKALPIVTAVTPSAGPTSGGNQVTISGAYFTNAQAASFGGALTSVTIDSNFQITATVPSGQPGIVDVTVLAQDGTPSATGVADGYTYFATPVVSAISPAGGPVTGGTTVTITGSGLSGATAVSFGGTAATFLRDSDMRITATAPAGTAGPVDITVTSPGGTSATAAGDRFTYSVAPVVSAISPAHGPASGGNSVIITGSSLNGATAVSFGATAAASFTVNSATQITATAPAGSGTVDITVTAAGLTSAASVADGYIYVSVPSVAAVSPSIGPTSGDNSVTITGTGLAGATAVRFGTAAANFLAVSDTEIQATAPAGTGTVDVTVSSPGGNSATGANDRYVYTAAPIVSALVPTRGPVAGGNAVIITGSNFGGTTRVGFGATGAPSFHIDSATQITATAPAGSAGTVDVTVTAAGLTSATSVADGYTYVIAPTVAAVAPSSGPTAGGNSVTITGSGFTGATAVKFGAAPASFTTISDTAIAATVPAGVLGTVDVTVTSPGGTSTTEAGDRYTYTSIPAVTAVSPTSGGTAGGTLVTITGVNFAGATAVKFGSTATSFTVASAGQITATAPPAGAAGPVDITVTVPSGTSATGVADRFTYTNGTGGQVYAYQSTLGVAGTTGTDNAHYNNPAAGAADTTNGHLFIADTGNHRVQVLDIASLAVVATIGTTGVAGKDNAHLDAPGGVGFDPATGHVLIADSGNDRIQVYAASGFGYVATLGVSGTAGTDNGHFDHPAAVHVNPANRQFYVADTGNNRVQVFDADTLAYIATLGASGVAGGDDAHFNQPKDAEFNPAANQVMVADSGNARVQLFDAGTLAYAATLGGAGLGVGDDDYLGSPATAAFDPASDLVLVADPGSDHRIQVFDAMTYNYVLTLGSTGAGGAGNNQFASPAGIVSDPAHARLFIGDGQNDRVQVYAIGPVVTLASVLPGSRSVKLGQTATVFASMINAGTAVLQGCQVALPVTAPSGLSLSYQTTNPATNALTGTPDTPATIAGNDGVQSFLISLQSAEPFAATDMPLDFACNGAAPAAVQAGVDTLDLTLSSTPVADIIALAATPSGNGIVEVPSGGDAAFAVASSNAGAGSLVIASVDTGNATLPLTATLCPSNPSTGQCLVTPAASVPLNIAAGATPTFSVFVRANGPIPLAPATARVFVRFKDTNGGLHGSTSVAVATE